MRMVREFVKRMVEEHPLSECAVTSRLKIGPSVEMFYLFPIEGNALSARKAILASARKHWDAVGGPKSEFGTEMMEDDCLLVSHEFEVNSKANPRFCKALDARSKARNDWRVAFADPSVSIKDLKAVRGRLERTEDRVKKHLNREAKKISGGLLEHIISREPRLVY